jgi:hypothetical protein
MKRPARGRTVNLTERGVSGAAAETARPSAIHIRPAALDLVRFPPGEVVEQQVNGAIEYAQRRAIEVSFEPFGFDDGIGVAVFYCDDVPKFQNATPGGTPASAPFTAV